jgi:membrane-bound lytic murein transglycosylase D
VQGTWITAPFRRLLRAALACSLLTVTACVHAPAERTTREMTRQSVESILSERPAVLEPAQEVTQVAVPTPERYADLFARLHAGFKLDAAPGQREIDQQLRRFVSHPEHLEHSFGHAKPYLYHIVTQLEARGMPLEIALLPILESSFEPYAYSNSRAAGLWQFVPGTGARFGLKQDWWYDGRRDIVESTRAALDYLQYLHDEFNGDWLIAIAAYDCGEGTVKRAIAKNRAARRPLDFWSLPLPTETRIYIPKLLAMQRLIATPERFAVAFSPIANQPYFTRVATQGQIDMKLAAQLAGMTAEELYELNPAFHRWATDPAGPHFLLLPVDRSAVFVQNLSQLSAEQRIGVAHYTVRKGDSVASVARRFDTSVTAVRDLNAIPAGPIAVGSDLRVPPSVESLPPKVILAASRVDRNIRFRPVARIRHMQVDRRVASRGE